MMRFDGSSPRCWLIAEIAQAHDGSLGAAHAYIDAVAKAGADAVKFQTHIASSESTSREPWRVKFSTQDGSRRDYWKRMEFGQAQWLELSAHAKDRGLEFLSSAFSIEAVDLLERVGVPAWKVGAGEISNLPMIERMARTGKPVWLSSGMSRWNEMDAAVETVRGCGAQVAVFQCTSCYPCPPERIGLNVLAEIRNRYRCAAGLSDHSGTIFAGLAAAALGAQFLEVHVTFSRECFGPDVPSSVTMPELAQLAQGLRFIETAIANPIDKERMATDLAETRRAFTKSIVAARDLPAGCELTAADLAFKKPGLGIPPARVAEVLNRRLTRPLAIDTMIAEEDLEERKAT